MEQALLLAAVRKLGKDEMNIDWNEVETLLRGRMSATQCKEQWEQMQIISREQQEPADIQMPGEPTSSGDCEL